MAYSKSKDGIPTVSPDSKKVMKTPLEELIEKIKIDADYFGDLGLNEYSYRKIVHLLESGLEKEKAVIIEARSSALTDKEIMEGFNGNPLEEAEQYYKEKFNK